MLEIECTLFVFQISHMSRTDLVRLMTFDMMLCDRIKKTLRLLLTSDNGYLYIYSLDTSDGGDCPMIRQFHLTSEQTGNAGASSSRKISESSTGGGSEQQQQISNESTPAAGSKLSAEGEQ